MILKDNNRQSKTALSLWKGYGVPGYRRWNSGDEEMRKRMDILYSNQRFKSNEDREKFYKEHAELFTDSQYQMQFKQNKEELIKHQYALFENNQDQSSRKQAEYSRLTRDPMLEDLLKERSKLCNRIENTGWRRIPNTSGMHIKLNEYNSWLKGTGLDRRLQGELTLQRGPSQRSRAMNAYLKYEVKALKTMVKKGQLKRFWLTAWRLMDKSVAFRTAAFNYCFYGWYKYRSVAEVVRINLTANQIIKERKSKIDFMRVFIPKANGKERPLGVPTCAWRLVLHMYSNFLGILLREELSSFNHAYLPRKGTLTCIKEWITKVIKANWVYEFDIKGFFDNVSVESTLDKLEERGLPANFMDHWTSLLESTPWNIDYKKGVYKKKKRDGKPMELIPMDKLLGKRADWKSKIKTSMLEIQKTQALMYGGKGTERQLDLYKQMFDAPKPKSKWVTAKGKATSVNTNIPADRSTGFFMANPKVLHKGLPQGAAISPVLSLLALVDWKSKLKEQDINLLMYADDGILYSDNEFPIFPPEGFEIEPTKSRWIKKNGNWEVESQKFLGIRYNHKTDLISGETRNGKPVEFGRTQTNLLEFIRTILPWSWSSPPPTRLEALFKSSIDGHVQSRLYNSSWEIPNWPEKWMEKMKDDSWWCLFKGDKQALISSKKLQITASSYACHWLGGLMISIVNPDNKRNSKISEPIYSSSPKSQPMPKIKGDTFVLIDFQSPARNWREWLADTISHFGVKRNRPVSSPTPQDIKESLPYNLESTSPSSSQTDTKSTSSDSRPSPRQAGPTSGFPAQSPSCSNKRKRVLKETKSLRKLIQRNREPVLPESKSLRKLLSEGRSLRHL